MSPLTLQLPSKADEALRRAREIVDRGGVFLFPTETVYGLGVRSDLTAAVDRLYVLKGRPREKPFQWLAADAAIPRRASDGWNETAERLARKFWPGPLTLVVKTGAETIGWRVPRHEWLQSFLRNLPVPLVATSANLSGQPAPVDFPSALRPFEGQIDLALDGGAITGGIMSTVVSVVEHSVKVLREGAISSADILQSAKGAAAPG
jgi:L-threonylcarbamoyladenylate synthase